MITRQAYLALLELTAAGIVEMAAYCSLGSTQHRDLLQRAKDLREALDVLAASPAQHGQQERARRDEWGQRFYPDETTPPQHGQQGEEGAVAWMMDTVNGYKVFSVEGPKFPHNVGKITPLYTRPAARARVPDGMVLVPREPTQEMQQRGAYAVSGVTRVGAASMWAAMVAAAPSAESDAESGEVGP